MKVLVVKLQLLLMAVTFNVTSSFAGASPNADAQPNQSGALATQQATSEEICSYGAVACDNMGKTENRIGNVVKKFVIGAINSNEAQWLIKSCRDLVDVSILQVVKIKKSELYNKVSASVENNEEKAKKEMVNYETRVRLAYEKHFKPIFERARNLVGTENQQ